MFFLFTLPLLYAWNPLGSYHPVTNLRVLAIVTAILCIAAALRMLRDDTQYAKAYTALLHYAWSVLAFLCLTSEINDCFRLILAAHQQDAVADWTGAFHYLILGFVLIVGAIPFMKIGWTRDCRSIAVTGFVANLIGIALLGVQEFFPTSDYAYLVRIMTRGIIVLPIFALLLLSAKYLLRPCPHIPAIIPSIQSLAAFLLGLALLSLTIWDGFSWMAQAGGPDFSLNYDIVRLLALGIGWALFALFTAYLALRKQYAILRYPGLGMAISGWVLVSESSFIYLPLAKYHFLLNFRTFALFMMIFTLLALCLLIGTGASRDKHLQSFRQLFYVLAALTGFQFIAMEIFSAFDKLQFLGTNVLLGTSAEVACFCLLGCCGSLYGVFLARIALPKQFKPLTVTALLIFALSLVVTLSSSFFYQPVGPFLAVWNFHALSMLVITGRAPGDGATAQTLCHGNKMVGAAPRCLPGERRVAPVLRSGTGNLAGVFTNEHDAAQHTSYPGYPASRPVHRQYPLRPLRAGVRLHPANAQRAYHRHRHLPGSDSESLSLRLILTGDNLPHHLLYRIRRVAAGGVVFVPPF